MHGLPGKDQRESAARRGYDAKWRKRSKRQRREEPICRRCERAWAVLRHHIVPKAEGGPDTDSNTMSLCFDCHEFIEGRKAATRPASIGYILYLKEIPKALEIRFPREDLDLC